MPVCPQCDNRAFSNKEALLQHMRSSSAWHPFCTPCDRRFVSQTAYEAHMAAKHPPTYDCVVCNRPYHAPFALEDHYRGSAAHPNCTKCGRGFLNQEICDEHRRTAHPTSACLPCGGRIFYDDDLEQHYADSNNHPSCNSCNRGFKDNVTYLEHLSNSHPEQHCSTCNEDFSTSDALEAHFLTSNVHLKCERCSIGLVNADALQEHIEKAHAPAIVAAPVHPIGAPLSPSDDEAQRQRIQEPESPVHTGFTPLSPRNPIQTLIIGDRRIHTPDLLANIGYSSPLMDTQLPPLTPTSLPRPGGKIDELWSLRENKQVPSPRTSYIAPSTSQAVIYPRSYHSHTGTSSSASVSTWSEYTMRSAFQPTERRVSFSPPRISPPRSEFDPRLYPGSLRANSFNRLTSSLPETSLGRIGTRLDGFRVNGSQRSPESASVSSASQSSWGRSRESASNPVNWRELMGSDAPFASSSRMNIRASLFTETSTPREDISDSNASTPGRLSVQAQNLIHSPSLATASISPASSAMGNSPASLHHEPDTRPTTASSSHMPSGPFNDVLYTITPGSECTSPSSPEVTSPVGLTLPPSISPLASTPIDVSIFDIPEAQKPLPDSPEGLSPATVIIDIELPTESQEMELAAPSDRPTHLHSPLSTSSTQTFITSPQEPSDLHMPDLHIRTQDEEMVDTLLASSPVGSSPPSSPAMQIHGSGTLTSIPSTPIATTSPKTTNTNPLHCRGCLADSCDDITATMCGHIFCNRCIVDAVIKTSRCPVCMTPTLLYCLFRLDLAA